MSALPPDDMRNLRHTAFAGRRSIDSLIARWEGIHTGAAVLARIARISDAARPAGVPGFVAELENAAEWQRELAWQGVQDIEAIMQSGMLALDVLEARGKDASVPALALWREVDAAQRSVLAMLQTANEPAIAATP